VVASAAAHEGLSAVPGRDLLVADGPAATLQAVSEVLEGRYATLGAAGRAYVQRNHDWACTLAALGQPEAGRNTGTRVPAAVEAA
jgi:polysaccharide biosynthesis protein PslH